ncbi:MAG: NADH-quinone oxidoreductase subunit NuoK [Halobacteriales archaeon]
MVPASHYLVLSSLVFAVGLYGVLTRENAVVVLICIELMLNAANLNLVALASQTGDVGGQAFALFVLAVAAAEVAVGLGIFIALYRSHGSVDVTVPRRMRW